MQYLTSDIGTIVTEQMGEYASDLRSKTEATHGDRLADSLTQIVRDCVKHAIVEVAERQDIRGDLPTGKLTCNRLRVADHSCLGSTVMSCPGNALEGDH